MTVGNCKTSTYLYKHFKHGEVKKAKKNWIYFNYCNANFILEYTSKLYSIATAWSLLTTDPDGTVILYHGNHMSMIAIVST